MRSVILFPALLVILAIVTIMIQTHPARAAEPAPGENCAVANSLTFTAGPEVTEGGGHALLCKDGVWEPVISFNSAASITALGNEVCPAEYILKFDGQVWTCAEGIPQPPDCSGGNKALQWVSGGGWECASISGGGGGGPTIVNGAHTQQDCIDADGTINTMDFGGDILCTFNGTACPSGWTSYGRWYRSSKTCTGACTSCTIPAGWFANTNARTCTYKNKLMNSCTTGTNATCTQAAGANVTKIACY